MTRFRNILVYADCEREPDLDGVVALATQQQANVIVCDVVPAKPSAPELSDASTSVHELMWRHALDKARRLAGQFHGLNTVDYMVLVGNKFIALVEQVIRLDIDLLVYLSAKTPIDQAPGLNSTAMHLARKCPCTVWCIPDQDVKRPERVVIGLGDPNTHSPSQSSSLVMRMANAATQLAIAGSELHLVHAWQPYGQSILHHHPDLLSDDQRAAYLSEQENVHQRWMTAVTHELQQNGHSTIRPHIDCAPVHTAISEHARAVDADLIVIGALDRASMPGLLIGNNAETLLLSAQLPFVIVKQRDFISPLSATLAQSY